jgi:hypothetical protein
VEWASVHECPPRLRRAGGGLTLYRDAPRVHASARGARREAGSGLPSRTPKWRRTIRRVVHDATKGERRAARERVSRYYESELAKLIDRVEEALTRYGDGEIDAHEVDDVIHRNSKATRVLWRFCCSTGSGSQVILVARTLEHWAAESDAIDWWDEAERPRRRRR